MKSRKPSRGPSHWLWPPRNTSAIQAEAQPLHTLRKGDEQSRCMGNQFDSVAPIVQSALGVLSPVFTTLFSGNSRKPIPGEIIKVQHPFTSSGEEGAAHRGRFCLKRDPSFRIPIELARHPSNARVFRPFRTGPFAAQEPRCNLTLSRGLGTVNTRHFERVRASFFERTGAG